MLAAGAVTAGGAVYAGMAQNAQSKYQEQVAEQNARLEEASRADEISRGETDQRNHYRRLAQAMGEARVRASGAGLDVGFGSAASLEEDIALIGYEDSATLSENTTKRVSGYDISASNFRNEGRAARASGKAALTGSLISATGTLLSSASQMKGASAGGSSRNSFSYAGSGGSLRGFG